MVAPGVQNEAETSAATSASGLKGLGQAPIYGMPEVWRPHAHQTESLAARMTATKTQNAWAGPFR